MNERGKLNCTRNIFTIILQDPKLITITVKFMLIHENFIKRENWGVKVDEN